MRAYALVYFLSDITHVGIKDHIIELLVQQLDDTIVEDLFVSVVLFQL
jgi:hypothetical protein